MAKSKRKRKIKEQDFKKVKLKVGKRLPKGQNVTDATFKSRSIVLPGQMSKDGTPTNQRKQTLKDLLSQVCHYSSSVRQEALVGLRDLVQLHQATLHENLSAIIYRIAEKFTDVEPTVRHSLLLLLRSIFPLTAPEKMAPFSALLSAHLSCAMTHIYEDIQLDSLNFLDLCLKHYPRLTAINSSQLLQNFISFIAHQSSTNVTACGPSVVTKPKSRFSSLGSRLKILQQLFHFLSALREQAKSHHEKPDGKDSLKKPAITFSPDLPTAVQVFTHSVEDPITSTLTMDASSVAMPSTVAVDGPKNVFSNPHDLQNFTKTVIPLLLDCWMECNPAEMTTDLPNSSTNSATVVTMATVIRILKLVLEANLEAAKSESKESDCQWFVETYLKDLKQNFMVFFPFEATFSGSTKKKGKAKPMAKSAESKCNPDMSVVSINIGISDIMSYFITAWSLQDGANVAWIRKLQEFVRKNFELKAAGGAGSQKLQAEHIHSLTDFVMRIVQLSTARDIPGARGLCPVEELLSAMFKLYQSSHLMSAVKEILFKFFASLVSCEHALQQESLLAVLDKWLKSLPKMLVQLKTCNSELTGLVLMVLAKSLMRGKCCELKELSQNLTQFVDVDTGFFLRLGEEVQRSTVELLFHLPSVDEDLLRAIATCCRHSSLGSTVRQYFLQVLHYRSPCYEGLQKKVPVFTLPSYLSFLFTVGIGFSNSEMTFFQDEANIPAAEMSVLRFDFSKCKVLVDTAWSAENPQGEETSEESAREAWSSHELAVKAVCQIYGQCSMSGSLLELMQPGLDRFLAEFRILPLRAIHGLFSLIKCWQDLSSQPAVRSAPVLSPRAVAALGDVVLTSLSFCVASRAADSSPLQSGKHALLQGVAHVLAAHPQVLHGMLVSLRTQLADRASQDARRGVAMVITRLLQTAEVKSALLASAGALGQVVSQLLDAKGDGTDQHRADLKYQHTLFQTEHEKNKAATPL